VEKQRGENKESWRRQLWGTALRAPLDLPLFKFSGHFTAAQVTNCDIRLHVASVSSNSLSTLSQKSATAAEFGDSRALLWSQMSITMARHANKIYTKKMIKSTV